MNIRHATLHDLDAITAVEAECFPAAEAATYQSIKVIRSSGVVVSSSELPYKYQGSIS